MAVFVFRHLFCCHGRLTGSRCLHILFDDNNIYIPLPRYRSERVHAQHCRYRTIAQQKLRWATVATIDVGRKLGVVPLFREAWFPSNRVVWIEVYLHTKWHLNPSSHLATTNMGRKVCGWSCAPFRGAESPSNTMWPGMRPTSLPSFILIHPAFWPQYTNYVTDRTCRQDRQRSDRIG